SGTRMGLRSTSSSAASSGAAVPFLRARENLPMGWAGGGEGVERGGPGRTTRARRRPQKPMPPLDSHEPCARSGVSQRPPTRRRREREIAPAAKPALFVYSIERGYRLPASDYRHGSEPPMEAGGVSRVAWGDSETEFSNDSDSNHGRPGQAASRENRRGHDGVQGSPCRERRQYGGGDHHPSQTWPRASRQARRASHRPGHHRKLHSYGRQNRRPR